MRFLLSIFTTVLVCLTLTMCKHDLPPEPVDCGEAKTIDEMMEWVYFKTGTYWIYEEQNSGVLDTMTVYYDYSGVSATGNREFVMKMRSSFDGYTYEYWFNDAWSTESSLRSGCVIRAIDCERYIPGDYAGGNHVFPFPLFIGNRLNQDGFNLEFGYSTIQESINIWSNGITSFENAKKIHQEYSPQHNYEKSDYTIVKNIGIVEKRIDVTMQNWVLTDYLIIQ